MELIKKNIHMNRQKVRAVSQITIDDDYNVPDSKQDIEKMILDKGEIKIEEIKAAENHVAIRGNLQFSILYISDLEERNVHNLNGKLPFEEVLNMEGVSGVDTVNLKWDIEDLTIGVVNSRKISIKAILTLNASVDELYDEEASVEVHEDPAMQVRNATLNILQLAIHKKDNCRIRDEIVLSPNKPNIYEVLWNSIQPRNVEIKKMDNQLTIHGELKIFVIYTSEEEEHPLQMLEETIPFHNVMECSGCVEEMIAQIGWEMTQKELEVKPDYDGEERVFSVECVLELDMKLYSEEESEILEDVYSTQEEAMPITEDITYPKLLMKNHSKCRATERIRIQNTQSRILQIAHVEGNAKVDDIETTESGIEIDGIIAVQILYITSDDQIPFAALKGVIPFHQTLEINHMQPDSEYAMQIDLEQLSATMVDSEEIEIKASVNVDTLVFKKKTSKVIKDIEMFPLNIEKLQALPGIVGYIADGQSTLWEIAKEYATTIEELREVNELKTDQLKRGDRLVIIKSVGQFLGTEG